MDFIYITIYSHINIHTYIILYQIIIWFVLSTHMATRYIYMCVCVYIYKLCVCVCVKYICIYYVSIHTYIHTYSIALM